MAKRPKIKQADGTLVDLPLDAETLQGKGLNDLALKHDVTDAIDNFNADVFEPAITSLRNDIPTKTSQLTNDSDYATTSQLFSGNYNDLNNKPKIPTKTSELTNDSGFITNAVNNLTNYYLKNDTYTKSEVQQLLSTISSLKLEVVANLPTTNISSNTIYLKSLDSAKENNIYEEYIYINNKWETIGTTAVDLTNYALKEDIPTKTSDLTNDSGFLTKHQDISGKADKTELENYLPLDGSEPMKNHLSAPKGISTSTIYAHSLQATPDHRIGFTFNEDVQPCIETNGDMSVSIAPNGSDNTQYVFKFPEKNGTIPLVEDIPTKISQLEQDVELGVSEEDVMDIIENNAEQTNTLDVGTSEIFDPTSDDQIPTSKAVATLYANKGETSSVHHFELSSDILKNSEWIRFAKVEDVTKNSSGIITINLYGKKDKEVILTTSVFNASCGIDASGKFISDVLPLTQTPELGSAGSSDGSSLGSDPGNSSSGTYGLTAIKFERFKNEIYIIGLINYPATGDYESLIVDLKIENNLNFKPLDELEITYPNETEEEEMQLLEGITFEKATKYSFVLIENLETYINAIENTNEFQPGDTFFSVDFTFNERSYNVVSTTLLSDDGSQYLYACGHKFGGAGNELLKTKYLKNSINLLEYDSRVAYGNNFGLVAILNSYFAFLNDSDTYGLKTRITKLAGKLTAKDSVYCTIYRNGERVSNTTGEVSYSFNNITENDLIRIESRDNEASEVTLEIDLARSVFEVDVWDTFEENLTLMSYEITNNDIFNMQLKVRALYPRETTSSYELFSVYNKVEQIDELNKGFLDLSKSKVPTIEINDLLEDSTLTIEQLVMSINDLGGKEWQWTLISAYTGIGFIYYGHAFGSSYAITYYDFKNSKITDSSTAEYGAADGSMTFADLVANHSKPLGGSSNTASKPLKVYVEEGTTEQHIEPNKYYIFNSQVAPELTLTFAEESEEYLDEFMGEIQVDEDPVVVNVPSGIHWKLPSEVTLVDTQLTLSNKFKYLFSIANKVGLISSIENPALLTNNSLSHSESSGIVSWSAVENADYYTIAAAVGTTATQAYEKIATTTETSVNLNTLEYFKDFIAGLYYIKIIASSNKYSDTTLQTLMGGTTVSYKKTYQLATPTNLILSDTNQLSWDSVEYAASYQVTLVETGTNIKVTTNLCDLVSSFTELATAGTYTFNVKSIGSNSVYYLTSEPSENVTVTIASEV